MTLSQVEVDLMLKEKVMDANQVDLAEGRLTKLPVSYQFFIVPTAAQRFQRLQNRIGQARGGVCVCVCVCVWGGGLQYTAPNTRYRIHYIEHRQPVWPSGKALGW